MVVRIHGHSPRHLAGGHRSDQTPGTSVHNGDDVCWVAGDVRAMERGINGNTHRVRSYGDSARDAQLSTLGTGRRICW